MPIVYWYAFSCNSRRVSIFFSPPGSDSFRSKLIFYWRLFIFFCHEISELRQPIAAKFSTVVVCLIL